MDHDLSFFGFKYGFRYAIHENGFDGLVVQMLLQSDDQFFFLGLNDLGICDFHGNVSLTVEKVDFICPAAV
jgi:hypothetical protein